MPKNIKTRIQNKHDLELNWNAATGFIPLQGELIVYDIEIDSLGNALTKTVDGVTKTVHELAGRTAPYTYERFKIGDGIHIAKDLPFATDFVQEELVDVKNKLADLLYNAITISSFVHDAGVVEIGTHINTVKLTWATNKIPTALTLDGESIATDALAKTISGLDITWDNNKTWTLQATDERSAVSTKTTSITFCNGIYYGVGTTEDSFNSLFVTALTKKLQTTKAYDFTANPNEQYIYYAVPKRLGTVAFKVGGFDGGFEQPQVVSVINSSGYTEDYYVYRSTNKLTGSIIVDVT